MKEVTQVPNKLYIGNIPFSISEDELSKLFNSIGKVQNVYLPTDKKTGRPRGFAFVEMSSDDEAYSAVDQLNGTDIGGRNIKVDIATERTERPYSSPAPKQYNSPRAKSLGVDVCIVCQSSGKEVFGFDEAVGGVCSECISALSKAARPPRNNSYRNPRY